MMNITALLLALTLTGGPVATVVCATECHDQPAHPGHCHDMAVSEAPTLAADQSCSNESVGESPYVIEQRNVPPAAVLTATSSMTMVMQMRTDARAVSVPPAEVWLKPPLVLRL